jgi:RNA polymerase sigma-70 factor (ECF subfamily)
MPGWTTDEEKQRVFEQTALAYLAGLYPAALRLTGQPAEAEDLVQDTFVRAYQAFDRFTPGTNARAWLYRIMHNLFLNRVSRAEARRTQTFSATAPATLAAVADPGTPDPAQVLDNATLEPRLQAALAALPVEFRAVLAMVDVSGLSYEEAAEVLGCPVGTVRSRLYRARHQLRAALEGARADA